MNELTQVLAELKEESCIKITDQLHVTYINPAESADFQELWLSYNELSRLIRAICNNQKYPFYVMDGTESSPMFRYRFIDATDTDICRLECCDAAAWRDFISYE